MRNNDTPFLVVRIANSLCCYSKFDVGAAYLRKAYYLPRMPYPREKELHATGLNSPTLFIHKWKHFMNIVLNVLVSNGAYLEKNQ